MHPSNPRSHLTTHCSLDSCTKRSFGVCAPPLLAVTADRKTRQTAAYFIFDPLIKTLSAFSPVTIEVKARQRIISVVATRLAKTLAARVHAAALGIGLRRTSLCGRARGPCMRAGAGVKARLSQFVNTFRSAPPNVTRSMDAAVELIERELPGWGWNCGCCEQRNGASLYVPGSSRIRGSFSRANGSRPGDLQALQHPKWGTLVDNGFHCDRGGTVPLAMLTVFRGGPTS
jgi:hypothetical protein